MRRIFVMALALGLFACMSQTPSAEEVKLETEEQKVLYAVGHALSTGLSVLEFSDEELDYIVAGLREGAKGADARVEMTVYGPKIQTTMQSRVTAMAQREKEAGQAYVDAMAQEEGAEKLPSGLVFKSLVEGSGATPSATDAVKVHYKGTLRDGSVFDSSEGGDPVQFGVGGVIPCFSEALQKMKVGGKAKLTCPSDIAYGDRGAPPKIMPGAALTFELELIEVVAAAPAATP